MIVGFIGGQGSGKTLSATKIAHKYQKRGYIVVSNMKSLSFPFIEFDEMMFKDDNSIRNIKIKFGTNKIILLLDEIHLLLDSRRSGANSKKSFLLTQVRKMLEEKGHMIYTTQYFNQIDLRLRYNTNLVIHVRKEMMNMKKIFTWTILVPADDKDEFRELRKVRFPEIALLNKSNPLYNTYEMIDLSEDYL